MKVNSLFWQFKTEKSPEPSLLFGTIHLGTEECMAHWDMVKKHIDRFDHVFTESSLAAEDIKFLQPFSLLEDKNSLEEFISERRWKKMRATFKKYCEIDIELYRILRPLFIIAQVQSRLVNAHTTIALDHHIWNAAMDSGKHVAGIETSREQVRILLNLDLSQQYKQLVRISKNITNTRKQIKKLLAVYSLQDINKLYKMSKATLGVDRASLLKERNHSMAARILQYHEEAPSFFSFGAGHLAGGNGVLRLLKRSGATLKPVLG